MTKFQKDRFWNKYLTVNLMDIYRILHLIIPEYALFSSLLRPFTKFVSIYCFLKQVSTDLKGLKSYRECSLITV